MDYTIRRSYSDHFDTVVVHMAEDCAYMHFYPYGSAPIHETVSLQLANDWLQSSAAVGDQVWHDGRLVMQHWQS